MKGMSRIAWGIVFRAVLLYCEERGSKREAPRGRLIGGNMSGRNVPELIREFTAIRRLRPDIEKPVWHNSLRLPPGDSLSDEDWCEVVADYMQRMGFSAYHPYCIWAHDDESAVHIVACRIGADGSVYLGQNENLASTRCIQALERDHGLRITKGPDYVDPNVPSEKCRPVRPAVRAPSRKETDHAALTGQVPTRVRLQKLIDVAVFSKPSVVELAELLKSAGVVVRANLADTGAFNGMSFLLDGDLFKGSQLGTGYSWKGLRARGVTYEQDRDRARLERFSSAVASASVHGAAAVGNEEELSGSGGGAVGTDPGTGRMLETLEPGDLAAAGAVLSVAAGPGGADQVSQSVSGDPPCPVDRAGPALRGTGDGAAADRGDFAAAGVTSGLETDSAAALDRPADGRPEPVVAEAASAAVQRALIADQQESQEAWQRQADALGAAQYRCTFVGRIGSAEGEVAVLETPGAQMATVGTFTAEEIAAFIPELRRRSAAGFDVYVQPVDPGHHFLVIDAMKPGGAALLEREGYSPCLVQSVGECGEQAVLKVPRLEGALEQRIADRVAGELNRDHGGFSHPGRHGGVVMAGLVIRHPGASNRITRLITAVSRLCRKVAARLQRYRDRVALMRSRSQDTARGLARDIARPPIGAAGTERLLERPIGEDDLRKGVTGATAPTARPDGVRRVAAEPPAAVTAATAATSAAHEPPCGPMELDVDEAEDPVSVERPRGG